MLFPLLKRLSFQSIYVNQVIIQLIMYLVGYIFHDIATSEMKKSEDFVVIKQKQKRKIII